MTGGSGVTISEYIVTVDGNMYQTIRYYGGDVLATIITGVANKHTVSVKSKNSCGLSSQPATTTVFKLLPDQPAPSHPLLYCIGSKNKGASWKVDVGVVYPRDAHVDMKPTVVNGSCSKNGPVSELIPQKEEQVNPVAFCYFTVAGVEDGKDD
ncbi:hypothetical protein GBAR_LOCUS14560 [Geodia barretti]|uniref:Uncharacterized protein n=1 Tax=Geodia barretti TaxID=519541 RepID=A0AA35WSN8_GEOBA|nr:hypothetical protein GBAR_LOCUS14560 [Geodia barretti]